MIPHHRASAAIGNPHTRTYASRIFIEEGAVFSDCSQRNYGPIYIDKNTQIQEVRYSRSLCLGPDSIVTWEQYSGDCYPLAQCKVGWLNHHYVIFGHRNTAHDGFLGKFRTWVSGQPSRGRRYQPLHLKNNYDQFKVVELCQKRFSKYRSTFCGLHGRPTAVASHMFNTGTVTGVSGKSA